MKAPVITREIAAAAVARAYARAGLPVAAPQPANVWAEITRPRTDRELAREVFDAEHARARAAGFGEFAREFVNADGKACRIPSASEIAAAEVRLAMRRVDRHHKHAAPARRPANIPVGGELVFDPRTDKIVRIGDADDTTPAASPIDPAREDEHRRFAAAEADFRALLSAETGLEVDADEWLEAKANRERERMDSHRMANKLEYGGTPAYRTDEYQLYICSVFSGHVEQIPGFRRLCFIPQVAAMVRASKVSALEYFTQCHRFTRFWTFTSGERVPVSGLRARIQELHARLNALNKELKRRYGVGLVFRSTELGTPETAQTAGVARAKRAAKAAHRKAVTEAKAAGKPAPVWTRAKDKQYEDRSGLLDRDEASGEALYHPHAHCLFYSPRGRLPAAEWSEMLAFVWKFWGHQWDEGGLINDAREACKYCFKSGELEGLSPAQLCELERAIHGLRLVTPMGILKTEIRARRIAGQKLVSRKVDGSRMWVVQQDVNKQLSSTEEERAERRAQKLAERIARLDASNVITDPETGEVVSRGIAHTGSLRRLAKGAFCRVVARLAPAAVATPRKEPRVVVAASRGAFDLATVRRHELVQGLWKAAAPSWFSADPIRVHEGTPTGETRVLDLLHETDERFAPPGEPVWERSKPVLPLRSAHDFALN